MSQSGNNLPKITIVVPVYNVEPYIGRCFDSIISQTYEDLECIFVDDCGNDSSMEIVMKRLANYKGKIDFKILHHERNRGLSAARNTGTDAANGEYVYYLDSDDLITADCISVLAEPLREHRVDFVGGSFASGGKKAYFSQPYQNHGFIEGNAKIMDFFFCPKNKPFYTAWNNLVNTEFLRRENLKFLEGIIHEDNLWIFEVVCRAESIHLVDKLTYIYVLRDGSIMDSMDKKRADSWVRIAEEKEAFARKHNLQNDEIVSAHILKQKRYAIKEARKYYSTQAVFELYRKFFASQKFSLKLFVLLAPAEEFGIFSRKFLLP